jgi:predicted helicase
VEGAHPVAPSGEHPGTGSRVVPVLNLRANHQPVRRYYESLGQLSLLHAQHEGAVRAAFHNLLEQCARKLKWAVIGEYEIRRTRGAPLRVDAAVVDFFSLPRGYWEAKDDRDNLRREALRKLDLGYPSTNILFQAPRQAILYQNGREILDEPLTEARVLVDVLKEFFRYEPPSYTNWERAVDEFRDKVPELGNALVDLIEQERKLNSVFVRAFDRFVAVCRESINPTLSDRAVEEMLIQHMLTERIFRKVFNAPDFVRRNAVAAQSEKVIDALTSRHFNRKEFLGGLDRFYGAIEATAANIDSFSEKQGFLNCVYEKFFQGFSVQIADTHGIVYTPQPIVRFMVRSIEELLNREFDRSLADRDVHVLDPFIGTGNFLIHVMDAIPRTRLPYKYERELHGNEVMLLPYYIASMNIEHEYCELTGEYRPFEGMCLVDTFELAEDKHPKLFGEENTARVERQRKAPIFVVLGNPPYNAWQVDENDQNPNRKYPAMDRRIAETYSAASKATLVTALGDPYVRAIRWATDRIGDEGIVAFVTNNSFIDDLPFDGMRSHLQSDFDAIYCLDLGGNVRKNPKLSGTVHNVFGIQVGVAITFFVRKRCKPGASRRAKIVYADVDEFWRREQKHRFLDDAGDLASIEYREITPDRNYRWLVDKTSTDFERFVPMGVKPRAAIRGIGAEAIFSMFTNGAKSNNDAYVYSFDRAVLAGRARQMVDEYNAERRRWEEKGRPQDVSDFVHVNPKVLKWIRKTKRHLARGTKAEFREERVRLALSRPFCRKWFFFDPVFSEDLYHLPQFFPEACDNIAIVTTTHSQVPFAAQVTSIVPCQDVGGRPSQCFPLYVYDRSGRQKRDNVTEWALGAFQRHYGEDSIAREDIFHYVYGVLHHPQYRARYEGSLKRELPRIPLVPDFHALSESGRRLAELHLRFESQPEFPLERVETPGVPLNWRVERMHLSKDRKSIIYNDFLTLRGVPEVVFRYRVGSRSALEWVIERYSVSEDSRSGIREDPNRMDDAEFVLRTVGQVITVSLETLQEVERISSYGIPSL